MIPSKDDSRQISVNRNRLEFLFDGIFAISMTLLVLELKVPELTDKHSIAELGQLLLRHVATFISYILSFAMLSIFWYSHNRYFQYIRRITKEIFVFHIVQLAFAAFFPFCAALFGRYPTNRLSMVIYLGCAMMFQLSSLMQWLLAKKQHALVPRMDPSIYLQIRKGNIRGSMIGTLLFLLYLFMMLIR
jgi:uncharacterized membrane protein